MSFIFFFTSLEHKVLIGSSFRWWLDVWCNDFWWCHFNTFWQMTVDISSGTTEQRFSAENCLFVTIFKLSWYIDIFTKTKYAATIHLWLLCKTFEYLVLNFCPNYVIFPLFLEWPSSDLIQGGLCPKTNMAAGGGPSFLCMVINNTSLTWLDVRQHSATIHNTAQHNTSQQLNAT